MVDPIKYLLAIQVSGYTASLFRDFWRHQNELRRKTFLENPNTWLLLLGAVPLAFASKSLVLPTLYIASFATYKMSLAQQINCFFCHYLVKNKEVDERAERRRTVLKAIYLDKRLSKEGTVTRLDTLEALDAYLAEEVTLREKLANKTL